MTPWMWVEIIMAKNKKISKVRYLPTPLRPTIEWSQFYAYIYVQFDMYTIFDTQSYRTKVFFDVKFYIFCKIFCSERVNTVSKILFKFLKMLS